MKLIWRFLIAFLAITGAVAIATVVFKTPFDTASYWDHHGVLFLVFIALFPRLTLLFSSVATGGVLWWLGWLFAPRVLVAVLATFAYWIHDPILVVLAWLFAVGGESSEKYVAVNRVRTHQRHRRGYDDAKWVKSETRD